MLMSIKTVTAPITNQLKSYKNFSAVQMNLKMSHVIVLINNNVDVDLYIV